MILTDVSEVKHTISSAAVVRVHMFQTKPIRAKLLWHDVTVKLTFFIYKMSQLYHFILRDHVWSLNWLCSCFVSTTLMFNPQWVPSWVSADLYLRFRQLSWDVTFRREEQTQGQPENSETVWPYFYLSWSTRMPQNPKMSISVCIQKDVNKKWDG